MKNPLVSIITINYNNAAVTCDLLRSIRHLNYQPVEVIVVDNASKDDPTAALKAVYQDTIVIRNKHNLGFSGGNNTGIRAAKGEYFLLVNNDTELSSDFIRPLLNIFEIYRDAGAVSPKFHFYFHPEIIEYAGYEKVNCLTARNGMIGRGEKDKGQYDTIRRTHYAHGGCVMVPRRVVDQVGLMPEQYFLYYEELDWSEQIKRKGFSIYYQPNALIHHKESMTTGKNSVLKTYYINRNRILFMRRNASQLSFLAFSIYLVLFTIPKNIMMFLLKREPKHLKAFIRGIAWHITPGKRKDHIGHATVQTV